MACYPGCAVIAAHCSYPGLQRERAAKGGESQEEDQFGEDKSMCVFKVADEGGEKAAVLVKEISTIKEKSSTLHQEQNLYLEGKTHTSKAPACENVNSFERKETELKMQLKELSTLKQLPKEPPPPFGDQGTQRPLQKWARPC